MLVYDVEEEESFELAKQLINDSHQVEIWAVYMLYSAVIMEFKCGLCLEYQL